MEALGKILRTISLAMLFGGSTAIVFAAIVLVKAAKAHGIPVTEAAATNAPIFITYSKVALAFAILLLVGEAIDYATRKTWNKPTVAQYICSLLCVGATMVFALGIVPPMERLLPDIKEQPQAKQEFDALHHQSQNIFGGAIVFALAALILPIFGALKSTNPANDTESA